MRRAGRLHAPTLDAMVEHGTGSTIALRAPRPGIFVPEIEPGDLVSAGAAVGELIVLGRSITVLVPGVRGFALAPEGTAAATGHRAVGYGDVLIVLDPSLASAAAEASATTSAGAPQTATGLVFRAPTSGRFYTRSAPDKPPFIAEGTELSSGTTICLLEVMKTFHRVVYGGPGLPDTARVRQVLVADGADVNAGDPLLALE